MIRIPRRELENIIAGIFHALGIPHEEAAGSADILVAADTRGIPSHGVALRNGKATLRGRL
jgi:LDH2 family malate/lactate/ureidoglycolate dehydrogenase